MAEINGVEIDLTPPAAMADEAQRGLDWREEHGRGGTETGVARARQLVSGAELSRDDVVEIAAWKARHMVDREAEGWSPGGDGYPSAGRIAAALWGLPAGDGWVDRKREQIARAEERGMSEVAQKRSVTGYARALGERQVRVVASTATPDRMGDVIRQDGIDITNFRRSPTVLFNHNANFPVARAVEVEVKDGRLESLVQFPPEGTSAMSDDVYRLVKAGVINATSVGFAPTKYRPLEDGSGLEFLECELLEFSFVSVPANAEALIVQRGLEEGAAMVAEMRERAAAEMAPGNDPDDPSDDDEMRFAVCAGCQTPAECMAAGYCMAQAAARVAVAKARAMRRMSILRAED